MARGRFISKCITSDKAVDDLSDDTSRLAFTWLITFADAEGRTYGDPLMLRSMLFPRRTDITPEQMEGYIKEWEAAGLITWYEANGDKWIKFPNFEKHQIGLRKDREPDSDIPDECDQYTDGIQKTSGKLPEDCGLDDGKNRVKLSKVKLSKVNIKDKLREVEVEEEVNASPADTIPSKIPLSNGWQIKVIAAVTETFGIPGSETSKVLPAMDELSRKYAPDEMVAYLLPFWESWKQRKRVDGQPVSKNNFSWLYDWAITGEIPPPGRSKKDEESSNPFTRLREKEKLKDGNT